jgi:hypothetical protein
MNTETDAASMDIRAEEGQYHLQASYARDNPWPETGDSLSTGEDNWIGIITGTSMGPVHVVARLYAQRPEPDLSDWEMVAERDLVVGSEGITIRRPLGRKRDPHIAFDAAPGRYRVRIHANGRAQANQAGPVLHAPVESHFIQIWAVDDAQPSHVLHGPDSYGKSYT